MAGDGYRVKGSTIHSKLNFVDERFGGEARTKMEVRLSEKNLMPIKHSAWYEYDLYIEVLESMTNDHFGGDIAGLVEVGAHSAAQALKTTYRAFVRKGGFVEFLDGMSRLHHMFYNKGEIVVNIHDSQHSCEVWHRNKPRYAEPDLYVASGFYQKAAELHGLEHIHCGFSVEDDGAHFDLSWD